MFDVGPCSQAWAKFISPFSFGDTWPLMSSRLIRAVSILSLRHTRSEQIWECWCSEANSQGAGEGCPCWKTKAVALLRCCSNLLRGSLKSAGESNIGDLHFSPWLEFICIHLPSFAAERGQRSTREKAEKGMPFVLDVVKIPGEVEQVISCRPYMAAHGSGVVIAGQLAGTFFFLCVFF